MKTLTNSVRQSTLLVGCGDRITLRLMVHGTKLTDFERFAILSNAFLHKENGAFGIYFYQDTDDQQRQEKHN